MIGGLQGEFEDLDIKYLNQNISKYPKCRSQIFGSFRRTPRHCAAKYLKMSIGLWVSAISGSGYVWPRKLKRSPLPSGVRIPDVKHLGGMWQQQNSGCDTSGWKVAAAGWKSYPGGMSYDSRLGGMSRIPYSLYSGFAYGFQRTLLNLGLLWWSKSYQNTKT